MIGFRALSDELQQVEFFRDGIAFPLGLAWVSTRVDGVVVLDRILVQDDYRRQKIGTALFNAVKSKWPNVVIAAANSAFLDSVEPWRLRATLRQRKDLNEARKRRRMAKKAARSRK